MKGWRLLIFGVLIGLLAGGAIILVSKPVRGIPIELHPAPTLTRSPLPKPTNTDAPIQVQISGEILNPGIYDISKGSRLNDLIIIAGGLTISSDEKRVNMATKLEDGGYYYIPAVNESIPETASNAPSSSKDDKLTFTYPININQANQEELESLPGIGPTKASDILEYRDQNGSFSSLEELLDVPGIGPATLEMIKEYLTIEP